MGGYELRPHRALALWGRHPSVLRAPKAKAPPHNSWTARSAFYELCGTSLTPSTAPPAASSRRWRHGPTPAVRNAALPVKRRKAGRENIPYTPIQRKEVVLR